ncbi:MAG TPA: ATP-binding cassette domain-containing protein [Longimicrobium sp.]|nr:ATP-binding cassette domain-containing protein [Longimicrobium sp.]
MNVAALAWERAALGEALALLLRRSGLAAETPADLPSPPGESAVPGELGRWLSACAEPLGVEAEPADSAFAEVEAMLAGCAPALLRVPSGDGDRYLALLRRTRRGVVVIAPSRREERISISALRAAVCEPMERPLADGVARVLERAGVPARRRERARAALLAERLGARRVGGCWLLRPRPGATLGAQAAEGGVGGVMARLVAAHVGQYALWIAAWALLGAGALSGRADRGWLAGWALLLATAVPLRALSVAWQGRLGAHVGVLLKRRLLDGALRLRPDEIRHQGAGRLLGRVVESEAVETLALSGGFAAVLAALELAAAAAVLAAGAGGWGHAALLAAWVAAVGVLAWRLFAARRRWTGARLEMTHDLVERMVGYRTRLAQEDPARRHDAEEELLDRYLELSARMDGAAVRLGALAGRGWLLLGVAALAPEFARGGDAAGIAVALGGVLLGWQSLARLAPALVQLPDAAIAWERVGPLFRASSRVEAPGAWEPRSASPADGSASGGSTSGGSGSIESASRGSADGSASPESPSRESSSPTSPSPEVRGEIGGDGSPSPASADLHLQPTANGGDSADRREVVLEAAGIAFGHAGRGAAVFEGVDARIRRGDRVLLEGSSGAGKSTLVAVLAGLREPDSGSLLLGGLDRWTVGAAEWRRRVAAAPQFHENHVFTETLAFNLLMGRGWPPSTDDLAEAEETCRALGLGELLDRMPSGVMQMVGEGGWQLSHGERSRLFLARALLQGGDVVVLDESFAALDPGNLALCLRVAVQRAPSLLVIAHP